MSKTYTIFAGDWRPCQVSAETLNSQHNQLLTLGNLGKLIECLILNYIFLLRMNMKKFLKNSKTAFVIYSLLAAIVIGLIIFFLAFLWLKHYTRHGEETQVPSICGMYLGEAQTILAAQGLKLEVIDSTYSKKAGLGTIVEQNPPANSNVKNGRTIYVIMNARSHRQVPMPELHDMSYRQAEATLNAMGLQVRDIVYEPSEYRDLVLDVRAEGESVVAGTRLPEGTQITLVVGKGRGSAETYVPDLKGKSLVGARSTLLAQKLIVGAVSYDEQPSPDDETQTFYVYDQKPKGGQMVMEGSHIDLYLSTDPDKKPSTQTTEEEDFF